MPLVQGPDRGVMGVELVECEDEALYGREYLQWKKKTLGHQVGVVVVVVVGGGIVVLLLKKH